MFNYFNTDKSISGNHEVNGHLYSYPFISEPPGSLITSVL